MWSGTDPSRSTPPHAPLYPRAHSVCAFRAPVRARPRRRWRHVRVYGVGGRDHGALGARRPPAETRRPRPHPTGRSVSSPFHPLCPAAPPQVRQTPPTTISSASSSNRPRPTARLTSSPGLFSAPSSECRFAPLPAPHPREHLPRPNPPRAFSIPTLVPEPSPEADPALLASPLTPREETHSGAERAASRGRG